VKDYARKFYKSQAWKQCRSAYAASKNYLCERCLKRGLLVPGEIVHHKVHLSPDNINDPDVTLNWDNLELVCRKCHAELHDASKRRYRVDQFGVVQPRYAPHVRSDRMSRGDR
jgi:5-methylcytosine-specific restriction protein A